ncbi:MAG TPA: hypothetical protein VGJ05_01735 [Fimbriiglobus sp.]|jgi:hypothetical protein
MAGILLAVGAVFFAGIWSGKQLYADDPDPTEDLTFKATYKALAGQKDFAFSYKDMGVLSRPVGMLDWEIPKTQFSTCGLDRNFRTFSLEPLVTIIPGQTYPFKFETMTLPAFFGMTNDAAGMAEAHRRVKYIKELYGLYYQEALKEPAELPSAFQTALWEIMQESAVPADGSSGFSLYSGDFRANYREAASSPEYVRKAEEYLQSLSGDDLIFDVNPAFSSFELVRMTGLPGNDEPAPQAQLALRLREGATPLGLRGLNEDNLSTGSPLLGGGAESGGPLDRSVVPSGSSTIGNGGGGIGSGGSGGDDSGFPGVVSSGSGSGGGSNDTGSGGSGGGSSGTGGGGGSTTVNSGGDPGNGGGGGGGSGGGGSDGTGGGVITSPVPAPPALILAGVGMAAVWLGRKARTRRHN